MNEDDERRDADRELYESGGGARYQEAHRQNVVEPGGPTRSRSARGTGPGPVAAPAPAGTDRRPEHRDAPPAASRLNANDATLGDGRQVRPVPDDESWLADLGFPKTGEHVEAHAAQVEHGPNAGGTQQGAPEAAPGQDRAT